MNGDPDRAHHPMAKILFGWVEAKNIGNLVLYGLSALSVALLIAEFLPIERHPKADVESVTGFYGFYGFAAFTFVVLMGWPLGRLLRRGETYYGDEDADGEGPQ